MDTIENKKFDKIEYTNQPLDFVVANSYGILIYNGLSYLCKLSLGVVIGSANFIYKKL